MQAIDGAAHACRKKLLRHFYRIHGRAERLRVILDQGYQNRYVQIALAIIILSCLGTSILANQVDDDDAASKRLVYAMEVFFAIFFLLELLINLAGNIRVGDSLTLIWFDTIRWLHNGWNIVDVIVVIASLWSLFAEETPNVAFFRTARVIRLLKLFRWFSHYNECGVSDVGWRVLGGGWRVEGGGWRVEGVNGARLPLLGLSGM